MLTAKNYFSTSLTKELKTMKESKDGHPYNIRLRTKGFDTRFHLSSEYFLFESR